MLMPIIDAPDLSLYDITDIFLRHMFSFCRCLMLIFYLLITMIISMMPFAYEIMLVFAY